MTGDPPDLPRSQVSIKTVTTVVLTVLCVAAAVYLLIGIKFTLVMTAAAAMLATALHHGVDWLRRRRVGRKTAILLTVVASMGAGAGVLLVLIPPAVAQARELAVHAPELFERVRQTRVYQRAERRFEIDRQVRELLQEIPAGVVDPAVRAVKGVLGLLVGLLAVWGITIFMLFFGEHLVRSLLNEALPPRRERYQRVLYKIYRAVGGYLTGLGVICGANALATTLFLSIIRVPFFLPLGILSGLSSLVPLVGATLVGTLITVITAAVGGLPKGIACAVFFILYQQFENHAIAPLVYRRTVKVNPLLTVVGLLAFAELGGIVGAILAIPVLATAQIIAREVASYRREVLNLSASGPARHRPADAAAGEAKADPAET
jgi:predicted PurR-regulated permease PerM